MLKRIFLFALTNLAVIFILSIVLRLLGVDQLLAQSGGVSYYGLLIFSTVFGFGGALISLAMSKWMALRSTGARKIEQPESEAERWLVQTVRRQAENAGVGMPDVAIFEAAEPNAFATGMSRNNALVAVSTGLLQAMDRDEVEAVLGHEMTHVSNGDMVTLTLIQGVLNTFVIFFSRVIGFVVDRALSRNNQGSSGGYFLAVIISQLILGVLATIIVMWFSRQREFRADAGGARLAGSDKMIRALQALQRTHEESHLPDQMAAFGILGRGRGLAALFMSHPPLEDRIAALRALTSELQ
jgi:heat shock protein HtpX